MKRLLVIILSIVALLLVLTACGGENPGGNNSEDSYTITYTNQAGEVAAKQISGQTGARLDEQSKTGYEFLGYFTADGVQYFDKMGNQLSSILIDRDLTLIPKFEPYKYTLILDAQIGVFNDGTSKAEISSVYGDDISNKLLIPSSTMDKYEFDGWFNEDGSIRYSNGTELIGKELINDNYQLGVDGSTLTFYAKFKVKELTITVDFCDGVTLPQEYKVAYGDGFGDLSQYTLDNGTQYIRTWSTISYGEVSLPDTVTQSMRIYAVWQNYKKVNFVYSGTIIKEEKIDITAGQSSVLPENAILPGFKFEGWYSSALLSGNPITAVPYGALQDTYYAKWTETDYGLDFITGTSDTVESIRYNYGDTTELPELTRTGYTFEGWSTGEEGAKPFTSIPSTLYGDLTLVAVWKPYKINVTLDANGGRLDSYTVEVDYESYYNLGVPTLVGYDFVGWYYGDEALTDNEGKGSLPWNTLEERTLVAKWEIKIYTVEFVTGTDEVIESKQYEHGAKIELPTGLKNGELFLDGWYSDEEFTNEIRLGSTVKADMTLYANWQEMIAITNAEELKSISEIPDFKYFLANDINLSGEIWTPIDNFTGTLDGQGHKIYNFALSNNATQESYGFFSQNSGTIKNIVFDDFTVNATRSGIMCVGTIVGKNSGYIFNCSVLNGQIKVNCTMSPYASYFGFGCIAGVNNTNGKIEHCSSIGVEANISTIGASPPYDSVANVYAYYGGICGENSGIVENCNSDAEIETYPVCYQWNNNYRNDIVQVNNKLGGIAGVNTSGTIAQCKFDGSLYLNGTYVETGYDYCSMSIYADIGSIVGWVHNGAVKQCIGVGNIAIGACAGANIGGAIGINEGTVSDSYSLGTMSTGAFTAGGFVGYNGGIVQNCYSASILNSSTVNAGAFCSINAATGTIAKCISLTAVDVSGTVKYDFISSNSGTINKTYDLVSTEKEALIRYSFLIDELYWDEAVWTVDKGGFYLPSLNWENE